MAATGRALGRLTDIGWGNRLRDLLADGSDRELPDDVFAACVKVLSAWGWDDRPVGVVTVGSRRRPQLVGSFGQKIATIGRLPLLGTVWLGSRRTGPTRPSGWPDWLAPSRHPTFRMSMGPSS